jgi:hypothetical protein
MMDIVAKVRAACARGGLFAGKWALIAFAGVAAFALAAQALALVLAALALLVIALCLATVCMPEESRAVWAWMYETLGRWSRVAAADQTQAARPEDGGTNVPENTGPEGSQAGQRTSAPDISPNTCVKGADNEPGQNPAATTRPDA